LGKYLIRRLIGAVPVIWGVATLVFLMMHLLPGDPAELMLTESGASADEIADLRAQLGLDQPLAVQYGQFLWNAVRGDLGRSIFTRRPVIQTVLEQLPATIQLATAATLLGLLFGVPLGMQAALNQNTWIDSCSIAISVVGASMPIFWSALLLIFLFAVKLGWLPATSQPGLKGLVLPAVVLGFASMPMIARLTRSSMLEVLRHEYVTTARAKGLRERSVVWGHAMRNALIPVVTMVGLQFGFLLGGTVVTETVFARQGVGSLVVNAILWKDFPVVQGMVLLTAVVYTLVNLLVDVLYAFINPMVRHELEKG
jgi:ABC-type dipeptide/oligopeptide/nickel transport system permease component